MDDAQLDDLKQFIYATVSQSADLLEQKIDQKIDQKINALSQQMEAGFKGVAEAVGRHNDQLDNHESCLVKLEQRVA